MKFGGLGVVGFLTNIFATSIVRHGLDTPRSRRVPNVPGSVKPFPKTPAGTYLPAGGKKFNLDAGLMSPASSPKLHADACIEIKAHQPYIAGLHGAALKLVKCRGLSLVRGNDV